MRKRILKLMLAGLFVACAFGLITLRIARATPGEGITTTVLAGPVAFDEIDTRSHIPHTWRVRIATEGLSDVWMVHIRIVPGGHSGWHSHPGPSFVTITAGTATFYQGDDPDRTPHVFAAGTGFVEDAGEVHIVRNEGDTDLELVVMQLIPSGADRRIDEPRPPHYDFG
jgi:quercetin dioxygenase-like cupin family protein